ncbi:hypothetical protein PY093_04400 [Cytobacillus sp. S13-E01]|uniref:hypothetical protein n=1 Tax=Cytobacillus sp. S13-E01 TaxID=3031326 RepID=UPI0023D87F91|nr:hypothetical protein [Cytobacillus sp. S13-E01]MDF0725952.1 hypothetical protein [Cytobacillus sp. S13-E01]
MEMKLIRIAEVAKASPIEKFTSLAHLINEDTLRQSGCQPNLLSVGLCKNNTDTNLLFRLFHCF